MKALKPINYEFTVSFLRDCQEVTHDTISTRKEEIQSHTDWVLGEGGNTVIFTHPIKPTIKIHIIEKIKEDTWAWIEAFDKKTGKNILVTKKRNIRWCKIYQLFGESEEEIVEADTEHLASVLVM